MNGKGTISLSNLNLFTSKYLLFLQKKIPFKRTVSAISSDF